MAWLRVFLPTATIRKNASSVNEVSQLKLNSSHIQPWLAGCWLAGWGLVGSLAGMLAGWLTNEIRATEYKQ